MPSFFRKRKPSEDSQKRSEHQSYWSNQEGADDISDVSGCELAESPSQVFSICKVQQKKVSIVHSNESKSSSPKGCDISCSSTLKVLDSHENKSSCLPEDIGNSTKSQISNVEKNRSKASPASIGRSQSSQTLNLRGNCVSESPAESGSSSSSRTSDIRDNGIQQSPKHSAYVRTSESFSSDAATMTYPPASVCAEGTESIQCFSCSESGEEYCAPSQYLSPVSESDAAKQSSDCLDGLERAWQTKFSDYERRKEQKSQEKSAFERHSEEKQREHTQLLLMNNSHKENISNSVRQDQERVEQGFSSQQRAQEAERQSVSEKVRQAEQNISGRISSSSMDNNRQKKSAEFSQAMEEDRIRMEQSTAITQEEADSSRKRDVAAAMQKMSSDSCAMSLLQQASDSRRQSSVSETYRSIDNSERKFERMSSLQVSDKSKAIAQISQEEEMQKAAFQASQSQKDAVHGYIRSQIKLIEAELMQSTKSEIKRRNSDAENSQEVSAEQRTALSDSSQQSSKQRDQREQESRQVSVEIEKKSDSNQQNYWMIQYQRSSDAKPSASKMQEAGSEKESVNSMCRSSAQHYLPISAHHHISSETSRSMTAADLKKSGINEAGIQKASSRWAQERQPAGACKAPPTEEKEAPPTAPSPPPSPSLPGTSTTQTPSPPRSPRTPGTPGTPVTPSAPTPVEGPGSSECVVCMETGAQVIFSPCGHVCCCQVCNDASQNCPSCRSSISQRIRLYRN